MIQGMLDQQGITSRIDGEFLQGGVGELQATGIVRVMTEKNDYENAKKIILEWDKKQVGIEPKKEIIKKEKGRSVYAILGFVAGMALMMLLYNSPVTKDGIDYNGDGRLDEKWTYVNDVISKTEIDRDYDGKDDMIYTFDRKGLIEEAKIDQGFDGRMETTAYFVNGLTILDEIDGDGDGYNELRIEYSLGQTQKIKFYDKRFNKPIKVQYFEGIKLAYYDLDTDSDGLLDTRFHYNEIEEVVKKEKLI